MDVFDRWWELIASAFGSFVAAIAGVLLRRAQKQQQGDERAWSRIWLDAPTVFVMGLTGAGVGQWLSSSYAMPELFGHILSAILGYLGPAAIDRLAAIIESRFKAKGKDDDDAPTTP